MSKVRTALRQRGFTLIEILVVIVIIGVLSIMGVSKYTEFTTQSRIRGCVSNQNGIDKIVGVWESQNVAIPNIAAANQSLTLNAQGLVGSPVGIPTAVPAASNMSTNPRVLFDYSKDVNLFICPERANILGAAIGAEVQYTWRQIVRASPTAALTLPPEMGGRARGTLCQTYNNTGPDGSAPNVPQSTVHRPSK